MSSTQIDQKTVSYVITRGPVDAAVAVDVYGITDGTAPIWVRLRFDPGASNAGFAALTRPELASRVYACDAPFDLAHRERYLQKAADGIAATLEKDALHSLANEPSVTPDNAGSAENQRLQARARFASYLLRGILEQYLDRIGFADSWKTFSVDDLAPMVQRAIDTSGDATRLEEFLHTNKRGQIKIDNWIPGFKNLQWDADFAKRVERNISAFVAMYGIEAGRGQAVWRVRYSLTSRPENVELWGRLLAASKEQFSVPEEEPENAVAENTEASEDPDAIKTAAAAISQNSEFSVELWNSQSKQSTIAIADSIVRHPVPMERIYSDIKFEHGIVFVHGIGPHKPRETLTRFGEPFLSFWSKMLAAATGVAKRQARDNNAGCSYHEFEHNALYSSLLNREDLYGITNIVRAFRNNTSPSPADGFVAGGVRVKDTVIDTGNDDLPASTLVRLSSIYSDYSMRESNVMLAEAHWTDKVISFSFDELGSWLFKAFPLVVASQFNLHWRAFWSEISMAASEISWFKKLLVFLPSLFIAVFHLGMMPVVLLLLMILQPVLYVLLVLRLIPIGPLQSSINKLVSILAGTIGQSHVLVQSPIRRNAIVAVVSRDIEKILEYCENVTVVAHSQGAEVVRIVASSRGWDRVSRWVTFGPGITPLNNLRQDFNELTDKHFDSNAESKLLSTKSAKLLRILFVLAGLPLAALVLSYYFGGEWEQYRREMVFSFLALVAIALIPAGLMFRALTRCLPKMVFSAVELARTHNYYASHDPVPDGPVVNKTDLYSLWMRGHRYMEKEIYNRHSVFQDHTSYLENIEEFVAPVGLEAAAFADFLPGLQRRLPPEKRLESMAAVKKRRWLSWLKSSLTFYFYWLVAAYLAFLHFNEGVFAKWSNAIQVTYQASSGFWQTTVALLTGPFKQVVHDLLPLFICMALFFVIRKGLFNWLFGRNQQRLYESLARESVLDGHPDN